MGGAARRPFGYWRDPVCLGAAALYLANRFLVKPATGAPGDFFHCHANDLLCLPFWLPLVLWVQRRVGVRRTDLPPTIGEIGLHWLVWSWFFEALAPSLPGVFVGTVADPWDVVAYGAGGAVAGVLWRSRLDPMRRGRAGWRPWWVHGTLAVGLVLAVLVFAGTIGMSRHDRQQDLRRSSLAAVAHELAAFSAQHGALPERLEELGELVAGSVDEYRREGGTFVLIAYGADGRPGGLGDAEDVYFPAEHQPPSPWNSWLFTTDGRVAVAIGCVLGTLLAGYWLAGRASTDPPFTPLDRAGVAEFVVGLGLALVAAAFILDLHRTPGH